MNRRFKLSSYLLAGAILSMAGNMFAAVDGPVVTNVAVAQSPDGSGGTKATITYDLYTPFNPCSITIMLSKDGGATFPFAVTSMTGDLTNVAAGSHTITWNIAADYPNEEIPGAIVRVTADDGCGVARDDSFSVTEDDTLSGNVLSDNGSGADTGDSLSVVAVNGDSGAVGLPVTTGLGVQLTVNSNGSVSYSPASVGFDALAQDETASDSFTYTVRSAAGCDKSATASITITGVNDSPDISDFGVGIDEDLDAYSNSTSGSDQDSGDTITFSINGVTPDGGGVTQQTGDFGTLTLNPDGSFLYDLDNAITNALPNGGSGDERFTVHTTDSHGANSYDASILFTINGTNDTPTGVDDSVSVNKNDDISDFDVLANDSDPDTGDTITVTDSSNGNYLTTSINANGNIDIDINNDAADVSSLGAGQELVDSFEYTVSDGDASVNVHVTVTITGSNGTTVANDDSTSIEEDDDLAGFDVLVNDNDPEGDTLTIDSSTNGTYLTTSINANAIDIDVANSDPAVNSLAAGEQLTDGFDYTISDPGGSTATAHVTVTINGVNDLPTANEDVATGDEDNSTPLSIDVLNNDTDPDTNDTLSVSSVDASLFGYGTAGQSGDQVTYQVDTNQLQSLRAGESRTNVVRYFISDGNGGTSNADVQITINGLNDAPIANNDTFPTNEDADATNVDVLANDSDVDQFDTPTVTSVGTATYGTVSPGPGGISYAVNKIATNYLAAGETLSDSFTYTISDSDGASSTATVDVTISGVNDPPTANDDLANVDEDSGATDISVLDNDTDPDNGDTLSVSSVDTPAYGTASIEGSAVRYTVDSSTLQYLSAGETLTDTFAYQAQDPSGYSSQAFIVVTITGNNDAPTATNDDASISEGDESVDVSVLSNDADPDGFDIVNIYSLSGGSHGSLSVNGDNTVKYILNNDDADVNTLAVGESTTDSFDYTIIDGSGETSTATVTVTISGTNDAPTANADDASINEGDSSIDINVLSNDTDVDNGDSLSVASATTPSHGTTSVNFDNSVNYALNNDDIEVNSLPAYGFITDSFDYTAADSQGATSTATVTVTINGANDAPTANSDTATTDEDTDIDIDVLSNDSDVDTGAILSVVNRSDGAYGTTSINGDYTIHYDVASDSETVDALAQGETLIDTFGYTIEDEQFASINGDVTVTITGINDAPTVSDSVFYLNEDDGSLSNSVSGQDVDNGTVLSYGISGEVAGGDGNFSKTGSYGTLTLNAASGSFTYVLDGSAEALAAGEEVTDTFAYFADDGLTFSSDGSLQFTIGGANDAPVAVDDSISGDEDNYILDPGLLGNDSDPDSSDVFSIISTTNGTYGNAFLELDGSVTYEVASSDPAVNGLAVGESLSDSFTYTIDDFNGGSSTATVTVTINGLNDAPIAVDDSYTVGENGVLSMSGPGLLANDTDVDVSDALGVVSNTDPSQGTVSIDGDGAFTYTPSTDYSGPDSFTYTISDGNGGTSTATVNITVGDGGPNSPPLLTDDVGEDFTIMQEPADNNPTGNILANDSDPDGDTLTVVDTGNIFGSYGVLQIEENGNYTYLPDDLSISIGFLEGTPVEVFTITVTDGQGHNVTETLTFNFHNT